MVSPIVTRTCLSANICSFCFSPKQSGYHCNLDQWFLMARKGVQWCRGTMDRIWVVEEQGIHFDDKYNFENVQFSYCKMVTGYIFVT